MKPHSNAKILFIGSALICGVVFASYLTLKIEKERRFSEHAKLARVQAERGDTRAETELGRLYYHGLGVPQDAAESARWYRKAADQGDAKAQYGIGYEYFRGEGVSQNYIEARRWFHKAADQGDARAQVNLGHIYYYGQGVSQDVKEAARWYSMAASQGNAEGQYGLGFLYYYGQGVPQDRAEANRLFHLAADQGNEDARRTLEPRQKNLNEWNMVFLIVNFAGGLLLLASSLPRGQRVRNEARLATCLAGSFVLTYGGLDLFRYLYDGVLLFSPADTALCFARDLFGGVSLAMLFIIVLPKKSAKIILIISCVTFASYNLIIFARYRLSSRTPTLRIFLLGCAWFIGMAITSAILHWLKRRRSGDKQNGGGDLAATKIIAG